MLHSVLLDLLPLTLGSAAKTGVKQLTSYNGVCRAAPAFAGVCLILGLNFLTTFEWICYSGSYIICGRANTGRVCNILVTRSSLPLQETIHQGVSTLHHAYVTICCYFSSIFPVEPGVLSYFWLPRMNLNKKIYLTLAAELNIFEPCNITQNTVDVLFQQVKQRQ